MIAQLDINWVEEAQSTEQSAKVQVPGSKNSFVPKSM